MATVIISVLSIQSLGMLLAYHLTRHFGWEPIDLSDDGIGRLMVLAWAWPLILLSYLWDGKL